MRRNLKPTTTINHTQISRRQQLPQTRIHSKLSRIQTNITITNHKTTKKVLRIKPKQTENPPNTGVNIFFSITLYKGYLSKLYKIQTKVGDVWGKFQKEDGGVESH
jgi:hypothetical protein